MGDFLYYVEGWNTALAPAKACELGLGHVFGDGGVSMTRRHVMRGPDGRPPGMLLGGPDADVSMRDNLVWQQMPDSRVWVGMDPDDVPRPEDVARRQLLAGHDARLGDGNIWHVPVARRGSECAFPRKLELQPDGTWGPGAIEARYRDLWDGCCAIWDTIFEQLQDGESALTVDDEVGTAVALLQLNYRIGLVESSMLGLWEVPTDIQAEAGRLYDAVAAQLRVCLAALDWPRLEEAIKKNADEETPANSNPAPGEKDD